MHFVVAIEKCSKNLTFFLHFPSIKLFNHVATLYHYRRLQLRFLKTITGLVFTPFWPFVYPCPYLFIYFFVSRFPPWVIFLIARSALLPSRCKVLFCSEAASFLVAVISLVYRGKLAVKCPV